MTATGTDDLHLLAQLTGTPQAWLKQCQRVVAAPTADQIALLQDETGAWARALRSGRPLPDGDALAAAPEIVDVRAAYAIRDLALHLAGDDRAPEEAVAALLDHAEDAGLRSVGAGSLRPLVDHLGRSGAPVDRLSALLRLLDRSSRPSADFAGLLACHLTDTLPRVRHTSTATALFDTADPATGNAGAVGRITLSRLSHGPPGLHPHPGTMAFFYSPTPAFLISLGHAWGSSPLSAGAACVLWTITLTGHGGGHDPVDGPANTVSGGSLGGAFGAALDDLHRQQGRRFTPIPQLPGLRHVQLDFRRRLIDPRIAISATSLDTEGHLGPVAAMDAKLDAAARGGCHTVITHPDTAHTRHDHPQVAVRTARTVDEVAGQLRSSRNPRYRRTVVALIAVVVTVAAFAGLVDLGIRREARQQAMAAQVAAAERAWQQAARLRHERPRDALLLGEAAVALNPTPQARAALTETVMQNHYAGEFADPGGVQALAIDADGQLLADATQTDPLLVDATQTDPRFSLWRLTPDGQPRLVSSAVAPAAIRTIAFLPGQRMLITGDSANRLLAWRIDDHDQLTLAYALPALPAGLDTVDGNSPAIEDIAVDSGRQLMAAVSSDGTLSLWSLAAAPADPQRQPRLLARHRALRGGGWSVAFDLTRPLLATGSGDGSLDLWSIVDPQRLRPVGGHRGPAAADGPPTDPDGEELRSIAFRPGRTTVLTASMNHSLTIWDTSNARNPRPQQQLRGDDLNPGHTDRVFHAAFTADGRTAVSVSADRSAILWEVTSDGLLRQRASLAGATGYLRALALSPDGSYFVTGSIAADGSMTRWSVSSPGQVAPLVWAPEAPRSKLRAVAVEPRRHLLAAGGAGRQVWLYRIDDPAAPRLIRALTRADGDISALAFSPDGSLLAAASWDGTVRLWSVTDAGVESEPRILRHGAAVNAIAFSTDGLRLASGDQGGTVHLWDLRATGQPESPITGSAGAHVTSIAFADHDRLLAVATIGSTVSVFDTTSPLGSPAEVLEGHSEAVYAVRPDPTGTLLVTSSVDSTSIIWSLADPRRPSRLATLTEHRGPVRAAAWGSGIVLSAGDDGTLTIHSLADPVNPQLLSTFVSPDGSSVLAIARDTHLVAATTESGDVLLYRTDPLDAALDDPLAAACAITGTGPGVELWRAQLPEVPYREVC